jgi:hypothetical protein
MLGLRSCFAGLVAAWREALLRRVQAARLSSPASRHTAPVGGLGDERQRTADGA